MTYPSNWLTVYTYSANLISDSTWLSFLTVTGGVCPTPELLTVSPALFWQPLKKKEQNTRSVIFHLARPILVHLIKLKVSSVRLKNSGKPCSLWGCLLDANTNDKFMYIKLSLWFHLCFIHERLTVWMKRATSQKGRRFHAFPIIVPPSWFPKSWYLNTYTLFVCE